MPSELPSISSTTSYFDVLGVPVGADDSVLTARYRELSRMYHPDRWATADSETQTAALDGAALINDAYRTLRDPFARAEYLLRRERGVSANDTKDTQAKPPQELFARVLELQEALMEYQEARLDDDADTMDRLRPDLADAQVEFEAAYNALRDRLPPLFARWDASDEKQAVLDEVAEVIGVRGYLRRVLTNLTGTLK